MLNFGDFTFIFFVSVLTSFMFVALWFAVIRTVQLFGVNIDNDYDTYFDIESQWKHVDGHEPEADKSSTPKVGASGDCVSQKRRTIRQNEA